MPVKVGYAEGKCPVCGRTYRGRRPADLVICDCYRFCPLCDPPYTVPMEPFQPDLTVNAYESDETAGITGDEENPGRTIDVLYVCNNHSPPHYSKQKPIEVKLG